jgi:hypothetical protein
MDICVIVKSTWVNHHTYGQMEFRYWNGNGWSGNVGDAMRFASREDAIRITAYMGCAPNESIQICNPLPGKPVVSIK